MDSRGYGHRTESNSVDARKVQKADREKLRRDRLNEQFLELGTVLDPDRPKNDKATILNDTIQVLKDLTSQVSWLKTEYNTLLEESHELAQEKNELREEKANLKSEIDDLNAQYQQQLTIFHPWGTVGPFAMPIPLPSAAAPLPIHPVQPFPFFHSQVPGTISNSFPTCPTCVPYSSPFNPQAEQSSNTKETGSETSSLQHPRGQPSDAYKQNCRERSNDASDVAIELELKTPGSTVHSRSTSVNNQDRSSEPRKRKLQQRHKGMSNASTSSSSGYSSSCSAPDGNTNRIRDSSAMEN